MKKVLLLPIIIFTVLFLAAQQKTIDSLKQILNVATEDTGKVNLFNTLSKKYQQKYNYGQAQEYATYALTLAEKLRYKLGIANSLENIGNSYNGLNLYDDGLRNNIKALKIKEGLISEIKKKSHEWMLLRKNIAGSYGNIAISYAMQGKYEESLKNYQTALKIYNDLSISIKERDLLKEIKTWIGYTYNMIGIIYFNKGDYAEALKNYLSSLKIFTELADKKRSSSCYYNNIANI